MIANLKSYPHYKSSCVEWLGDVPTHWEVRRLKRVASLNPSKTESQAFLTADMPVIFLPMERVGADGKIDEKMVSASSVWNGFTYFRRDDVLVAKITPCFENGKGACLDSLSTVIGFGSTEFHVLRSSPSVLPQFLYRLTALAEFRHSGAEEMTGAAGQQRVPQAFVANYPLPLPPLSEQTAIVRYLDHTDERICHYISSRERLIELLEEYRQAVIHHAVTRGLDPDVRLKPSGVEWLGDVPAHWEVRRFKTIGKNFTNGTTAEQLATGISDFPVSRIETISTGQITYSKVGYLNESSVIKSFYLQPDDFLISHINSYERVGNSARYKGERALLHGMNLIRITPLKVIVPNYLEYLLKSSLFIGSMQRACKPAINQVSVTTAAIKAIQFPLPPLAEQTVIVRYLNKATADIDAAIDRARREIELLGEYRTRLIADVVTGKVDVREAAAELSAV
ncbi:MAG: restriction endonuclease subunit S [Gemmatimonadetes bacterium]|nr:restriction endonuclease subunit S [Gemmatimonadota bacterium]